MRLVGGRRLTVLVRRAVAVLGAAVVLAACSGDDGSGGADPEPAEPAPVPTLVVPDGGAAFDEPVALSVENGTITSAEVVGDDGEALAGVVDAGGGSWLSEGRPVPGAVYDVAAEVTDADDAAHSLSGTFTVTEVPDDRRLTLSVVRGGGEDVGVGTPIIVRFEQPVAERAAVEQAMTISSNPQVIGAWHWLGDQEVHFRPQEYWPAGTRIRADLELNGVQAGEDLWGGRSYSYDIEVGDEQIARVDALNHTMSVIRNGETIATWDTSLGSPEFATRNGTYVVLSKDRERNMTSCGANITCDEGDPEFYDVDTDFAVRLTNSGTFVHSAPWSETSQGEDNVSHGCLNLSEVNAETYFEMTRYGDVVEVVNSTREADDLVARGDPGMVDWNMSWSEYVAGSALGAEVTTAAL